MCAQKNVDQKGPSEVADQFGPYLEAEIWPLIVVYVDEGHGYAQPSLWLALKSPTHYIISVSGPS